MKSYAKDALKSPESRFYIIGMKSYGRSSKFLMRIGYEQVESIMELIIINEGIDERVVNIYR